MFGASLLLVVLGLIVMVMWIILPFLVIGTNRRLDHLAREMRDLNAKLTQR